MFNAKGLAQIPLILGLVAILGAIPFAVRQVQQAKILDNKAASSTVCLQISQTGCFTTPCCLGLKCLNNKCSVPAASTPSLPPQPVVVPPINQKLPCNELRSAQKAYCHDSAFPRTRDSVPCSDVTAAIASFCPEIEISPAVVSKPPIATPSIISCPNGQIRCIGHLLLTCTQGVWLWKDCGGSCIDNRCVPFPIPK